MQQIAILVFANSSKEDLRNKPIHHGEVLYDGLTKHTLREVKKTSLPFFHLTEKEQKGNTFGERFSNAVQEIFNKGFENVIAIGNDSPQLCAEKIKYAAKGLLKNNAIVGPSHDGGFYLLGIHKNGFIKKDFIKLPWQKSSLLGRLSEYLRTAGFQEVRLETLRDIDALQDIFRVTNFLHSIPTSLKKLFAFLLHTSQTINNKIISFFLDVVFEFPFNKGSPSRFPVLRM